MAGGEPAASNVFRYQQDGQWLAPPMTSKMLGIALKRGERVRLETPGGGGYGPPAQRSEAARRRDRDMGYVSGADAAGKGKGMTMATTQQSLVVGVDVGGTFTDLFVLDEHTGERA